MAATRKNTRKHRSSTRKNQAGGRTSGFALTVGSKHQVFNGTAAHTVGGLKKSDLVLNKRGRIVSLKQQAAGKKAYKRLVAAGYKPKKGVFKLFTKKSKRA